MNQGTRWFLFTVGACMVWLGLSLVGGGLGADAVSPRGSDLTGGLVAAGFGLVFLVPGLLTCGLTKPRLSAVLCLFLGATALITAVWLAIAGYVVQHIDAIDYDGAHAAGVFYLGAMLSLAIATACAVYWWTWLSRRGSRQSVHNLKQWLAIGAGSVAFVSGLNTALAAIVVTIQHATVGRSDLEVLGAALALAASAALYIGAGSVLVWHGAASLTGVASLRVKVPPFWIPLAGALGAIALGGVLLQAGLAPGLIPLLHIGAVLLPGLTILALAARGCRRLLPEGRPTWRELLTMSAYGSAVAASIAGLVNGMTLYGTLVVFLASRGAFSHIIVARDWIHVLTQASVDAYLSKGDQLVLLLAWVAVLVPFNEEFWKGFGVRMLRDSRPTRYQAFLFGVAAGVGFGAVEAAEYGTAAFVQSPYRWWDGALLRGGASSLHALATGSVGLGWYYFVSGRRGRGAALYLLAVGLHGSWNAINVLTSARVLPGFKDLSNHDLQIVLEVAVGVLAAGVLFMLWKLSGSLAEEDRAAQQLEPPQVPDPTAFHYPWAASFPGLDTPP